MFKVGIDRIPFTFKKTGWKLGGYWEGQTGISAGRVGEYKQEMREVCITLAAMAIKVNR